MSEKSALRILALDDEPFMLNLLSHMLANLGYNHVSSFDKGHCALEQIDSSNDPPDIILLDINMPEMDGIEFLRHLVKRRFTGSLILISAEDERMLQTTEALVQAHNLSILGYLHKPFNPENLSALLDNWTSTDLAAYRKTKKTYNANEVRAANANGEFVNYYQPLVNLTNGKVEGVESLVRWRHPQDGMVFPDQFIGVAEEHGVIDDLTWTVVSEAFTQCKTWQNEGLHLQIAINLSMKTLTNLAFTDDLIAAAASAGIAPDSIMLELTESQLMNNVSATLEILTRLRLHRFSLSIDDFGTGHSSLMQLRDIPFNELKIDRGFVHGVATNVTLQAIYNSSLSLAQQLNIKTVAEGVEGQADWDFLRRSGCDFAQGYFMAKPMPATEISAWISTWEENVENLTGASDAV